MIMRYAVRRRTTAVLGGDFDPRDFISNGGIRSRLGVSEYRRAAFASNAPCGWRRSRYDETLDDRVLPYRKPRTGAAPSFHGLCIIARPIGHPGQELDHDQARLFRHRGLHCGSSGHPRELPRLGKYSAERVPIQPYGPLKDIVRLA